ncbi:MAG: NADH-ubiquinone oxidoreductase chain [Frankiales bacterium]|jgi:multicomponent Na+:H+ antiporter subunit C|nr:NADH-ubiquinone oxidoreductase chain [Frankiales bacterium]
MTVYPYLVAVFVFLVGAFGIVRSRNLIHAVVCLSVAQAGTYLLLVAVGFQWKAPPPVFGSPPTKPTLKVTDPLVQAMALTDVVVSGTVTALLLAIAVQVAKRQDMSDPNELAALRG